MQRAPKPSSMRERTPGSDAPGSPVQSTSRTDSSADSSRSWTATSSRRSAYVGVHQTAVASISASVWSRCAEVMPPSSTAMAPTSWSPSWEAQNWTCGPNENASPTRSSVPTPATVSVWANRRRHQAQSSAVSSTRSGRPVVPLVCQSCVYFSSG